MANTPANAGSSEGQVPRGDTGPRTAAGHRAARPSGAPRPLPPAEPKAAQTARATQTARAAQKAQAAKADIAAPGGLAWLPYLIALAGVAAGVYLVFQDVRRGTGLIGCSLLAAGLARLVLPPSLAGLLSTRRKASDVLAFTVFGAGVLAVAILLP